MSSFPNSSNIIRHELDNGIVVLIHENMASPSVVVEGLMRTGALADSDETAGLAAMTCDMLMRGTKTRSFDDIYAQLESSGARLGFGCGRLITDFSGSGLSEDLGLLLEIAADCARRPVFSAEHADLVRGETIADLNMQANDTRAMAGRRFRELLYSDHPYARPVDGTLETVPTLTPEMMADYHANYFGPRGMVIIVVGGVKADDALAQVKAHFGDWQNEGQQTLPEVPDAPRPAETVVHHHEMSEKTQTDIVLGLPGPLRSNPDFIDTRVANTILGVFGMSGRIGKSVREEQGLAYYAFSRLRSGLGPNPWLVSTGVSPDKVTQAIDSIKHEIRRIQEEPVSEDELSDTIAYLTGSLPLSLETNRGMASVISDMEVYELGLDYLEGYADSVRAVTAERVQKAAQTYFSAEEIAISTAGPTVGDA